MSNLSSKASAALRSGSAVGVALALSMSACKADDLAGTRNCEFRPESSIPRNDGSEPRAHTNLEVRSLAPSAPGTGNSAPNKIGCPPRQ
jgi:hypothetical protein